MDLLEIIRNNTTDTITKGRLGVLFGQDEPPILEKAKHGVYANTPENKKLNRVGAEYGTKGKGKEGQPKSVKKVDPEMNKKPVDPQIEQKLKKYAKETPTEQLQKFIFSTKDEVAKLHAENEMKNRKNDLEKKKVDLGEWKPVKVKSDLEMATLFNEYDSQLKELDEDQVYFLEEYREKSFRSINGALRGFRSKDQFIKDSIETMDGCFDNFHLNHDIELYRGINVDAGKFFQDLKEGEIYEDKGYVSTSVSKTVSQDRFGSQGASPVSLVIKAKKGQKAIPMENLGDESTRRHYGGEFEFLLPRSSRFKVQKVEEKDGKKQIFLEML